MLGLSPSLVDLVLDLDVTLADGPFRTQMKFVAANPLANSGYDVVLGCDWFDRLSAANRSPLLAGRPCFFAIAMFS